MLHSAGAGAASAEPPPKKMGLLLALYNANVTTDWVKVVRVDRVRSCNLSSRCRISACVASRSLLAPLAPPLPPPARALAPPRATTR